MQRMEMVDESPPEKEDVTDTDGAPAWTNPPDPSEAPVGIRNMGGRQLYDMLRSDGLEIPLVFTSGYSARDVAECADLEGEVPFLSKPWTLEELLTIVREALESGAPTESVQPTLEDGGYGSLATWYEVSGVPPLAESAWIEGWRSSHSSRETI